MGSLSEGERQKIREICDRYLKEEMPSKERIAFDIGWLVGIIRQLNDRLKADDMDRSP